MLKPVKNIGQFDGTVVRKANCDVDLAMDTLIHLSEYEEAIIMSGDGDFARLVRYLKEKDREVIIIANRGNTAINLKKAVGKKFININKLRPIIEFENEK